MAGMLARQESLGPEAGRNLARFHLEYEEGVIDSIERFASLPAGVRAEAYRHLGILRQLVGAGGSSVPGTAFDAGVVYRRREEPKGPMAGFGSDYLEARLDEEGLEKPGLLSYSGTRGGGSEYTYEALNLVDGERTVGRIRNDLAAIYGEVPLDLVMEFLEVLDAIGVIGEAPLRDLDARPTDE